MHDQTILALHLVDLVKTIFDIQFATRDALPNNLATEGQFDPALLELTVCVFLSDIVTAWHICEHLFTSSLPVILPVRILTALPHVQAAVLVIVRIEVVLVPIRVRFLVLSGPNSGLLEVQQLDVKLQSRIRGNVGRRAARSVGELGRQCEDRTLALAHRVHGLVPTLDDLVRTQGEGERLAPGPRRVELLSCVCECTDIVDGNPVA
mmetsp:Transcript_71891/g.206472  ORF Transcript_71891/g.206472 Transcript_71891/m.206472 type:complete len:207 (+) Transcript_71891:146-766(+)